MTLNIGTLKPSTTFLIQQTDLNGLAGYFSDSQSITTIPTHNFGTITPPNLYRGVINHIIYLLTPTNPVTYTLRLWMWNYAGAVGPAISLQAWLLFQSAAAKAGGTRYEEPSTLTGTSLNIPFSLPNRSLMYYSLEWSGAPGLTPGVIELKGMAYDY